MTAITDTDGARAALRNLKLSGMLGTLDARLAQAHAGELGHLDFLQVLCQDEICRRSVPAIGRRLHRARFEEQATLEGFDFTASPEAARRPDPRPRRPALAASRRVRHPLRARRRRQEPHRPGPRPPGHPRRPRGPVRQDQPRPRPPRRRPRRPHLGQTAPS